jgi:hypothetical protein
MNNSSGEDIDASQVQVVGIPNRYVPGGGFGGNCPGNHVIAKTTNSGYHNPTQVTYDRSVGV